MTFTGIHYHDLYWKRTGEPIRCFRCDHEEVKQRVTDSIDGYIVLEKQYYCAACGQPLAFWAHGYFDPGYLSVATPKLMLIKYKYLFIKWKNKRKK